MSYSPKVKRQAARLGITLPAEDAEFSTEGAWSSVGADTLFEGPCMLSRRNDGRWAVSLRRSGKRGGYKLVTEVVDLEAAMQLATFLGTRKGRQAYRGTAPKERRQAEPRVDADAALRDALGRVNGGAVTVR